MISSPLFYQPGLDPSAAIDLEVHTSMLNEANFLAKLDELQRAVVNTPGSIGCPLNIPKGHFLIPLSVQSGEIIYFCESGEETHKAAYVELKESQKIHLASDLHANKFLLQAIERQMRLHADCTGLFVFMGDFVDKGPHSFETLLKSILLARYYPKRVVILHGNHELYLGDVYNTPRDLLIRYIIATEMFDLLSQIRRFFLDKKHSSPNRSTPRKRICIGEDKPQDIVADDEKDDDTPYLPDFDSEEYEVEESVENQNPRCLFQAQERLSADLQHLEQQKDAKLIRQESTNTILNDLMRMILRFQVSYIDAQKKENVNEIVGELMNIYFHQEEIVRKLELYVQKLKSVIQANAAFALRAEFEKVTGAREILIAVHSSTGKNGNPLEDVGYTTAERLSTNPTKLEKRMRALVRSFQGDMLIDTALVLRGHDEPTKTNPVRFGLPRHMKDTVLQRIDVHTLQTNGFFSRPKMLTVEIDYPSEQFLVRKYSMIDGVLCLQLPPDSNSVESDSESSKVSELDVTARIGS